MKPVVLTLDLKRRLMTPFERLSAVRSVVPQTDMLLLSLLALMVSPSSAPPTTAKDRPVDGINFSVSVNRLREFCDYHLSEKIKWHPSCFHITT